MPDRGPTEYVHEDHGDVQEEKLSMIPPLPSDKKTGPGLADPIDAPPNYGNGTYAEVMEARQSPKMPDKSMAEVVEEARVSLEQVGNDLSAGGGLRFNKGKNLMELVPPEWEWALADVTTQGSKKYPARNWEKGMEWSAMIGCMKRHTAKFMAGESYDGPEFNLEKGETGCHHLAMVAWNALALMCYDLRGVGKNDLPELPPGILALVNAIGVKDDE